MHNIDQTNKSGWRHQGNEAVQTHRATRNAACSDHPEAGAYKVSLSAFSGMIPTSCAGRPRNKAEVPCSHSQQPTDTMWTCWHVDNMSDVFLVKTLKATHTNGHLNGNSRRVCIGRQVQSCLKEVCKGKQWAREYTQPGVLRCCGTVNVFVSHHRPTCVWITLRSVPMMVVPWPMVTATGTATCLPHTTCVCMYACMHCARARTHTHTHNTAYTHRS